VITVRQVVTGDTYTVRLTLDPGPILAAFAPGLSRAQTASLAEAFDGLFQIQLTPDECDALASQLYEAAIEPARCEHDEAFSVVVVNGIDLCRGCASALDMVQLAAQDAR
jgi:hypothetical protein